MISKFWTSIYLIGFNEYWTIILIILKWIIYLSGNVINKITHSAWSSDLFIEWGLLKLSFNRINLIIKWGASFWWSSLYGIRTKWPRGRRTPLYHISFKTVMVPMNLDLTMTIRRIELWCFERQRKSCNFLSEGNGLKIDHFM